MRRGLAILIAAVIATVAVDASAFHVASTFADPPGAGGAGRIFYLGRPLERGWDCTACHIDPPGRIRIGLSVEPAQLFEDFRYQLGQSYTFTVVLEGEHLGINAGTSNFNALGLSFADPEGIALGNLGGFDPNDLQEASGTLVSRGTRVGAVDWAFTWTAPEDPGAGTVVLFLGVVDGDGAQSPPDVTRTDPFGDDVFMSRVTFAEGGAATAQAHPRSAPAFMRPRAPLQPHRRTPTHLAELGLVLVLGLSLRLFASRWVGTRVERTTGRLK
jgi:hypothetical protein